jgi:predicted nucleic acid-binding protein
MILLDTCVVSEAIRPDPDPRVMAWLDSLVEDEVSLSTLVLGELRKGVELLPDGNRRAALALWIDQLTARFRRRLLAFDLLAADRWGTLVAQASRAGKPLAAIDGQLAAQALVHGAVLATRNTADFEATGCLVLNPWLEP